MNIIKLTKPIFWAFMVLVVQVLFNLILLLIFGPQSVTTKLLLGISGLVLCIVVTLLVMMLIRRPIPADHILISFGPFPIGILGLTQVCVGSVGLPSFRDLLEGLPPGFLSPWQMSMNISVAIMLPVGILISILSVLQLILNRRSNR
jgi:hypothetical protein